MLIRGSSVRFLRAFGLAVCILFLGSGCWWQRDSYTKLMRDGFANFEKRAERERLLGVAFQPAGDFSMWIRPPNPTTLVQTPEQFLAWFQGNNPGGPLIEVILMGSTGAESLAEFQQNAFNAMAAAQKFPPQNPDRIDPQSFTSMHDSSSMTFEQYQGAGKRQVQAAGGAAATAIDYQWFLFFGEQQTQKIMVCFIIPDSIYADFYRTSLTTCMESLALGPKVGIAQQTGGGVAPAGGGGGANF